MGMILQAFKHLAEPAWNPLPQALFRGASETSEPENPEVSTRFRARAGARPGMTRVGF